MNPTSRPSSPSLQFDRAVSAGAPAIGVVCSQCGRTITQSYFTLDNQPFCAVCKAKTVNAIAATRTSDAFLKAFMYGLGAAAAGSLVYYLVLAILGIRIGIVTLLIGYMVGYAIHKAVGGNGSRRYQILAVALVYFAVSAPYLPFALADDDESPTAHADSSAAARRNAVAEPDSTATPDSAAKDDRVAPVAAAPAKARPAKRPSPTARIASAIVLLFTLPIVVILGGLPFTAITALIIGYSMRRAWRMTAGPDLTFVGPLKVAPPPLPELSE